MNSKAGVATKSYLLDQNINDPDASQKFQEMQAAFVQIAVLV